MDLSNTTLFRMARQKMSWLGERQTVLAQNIANADTPRYRSHDLVPINFERELQAVPKVRMAATTGNHLSGTVPPTEFRNEKARLKDVYEVNPDGNSVVMEEQLMKIADNQMQYQLAASVYQKNLKMFRLALGAPGQG
jgi:flagellar basal-body rod protein FlgB